MNQSQMSLQKNGGPSSFYMLEDTLKNPTTVTRWSTSSQQNIRGDILNVDPLTQTVEVVSRVRGSDGEMRDAHAWASVNDVTPKIELVPKNIPEQTEEEIAWRTRNDRNTTLDRLRSLVTPLPIRLGDEIDNPRRESYSAVPRIRMVLGRPLVSFYSVKHRTVIVGTAELVSSDFQRILITYRDKKNREVSVWKEEKEINPTMTFIFDQDEKH
jgi:hypothetical protein